MTLFKEMSFPNTLISIITAHVPVSEAQRTSASGYSRVRRKSVLAFRSVGGHGFQNCILLFYFSLEICCSSVPCSIDLLSSWSRVTSSCYTFKPVFIWRLACADFYSNGTIAFWSQITNLSARSHHKKFVYRQIENNIVVVTNERKQISDISLE